MNKTKIHFGVTLAVTLLAGTAMLSGCGGGRTSTTTTEQTTTTAPRPVESTTTTTTQEIRR